MRIRPVIFLFVVMAVVLSGNARSAEPLLETSSAAQSSPSPSPSPHEAEAEQIIVSANRLDIPLDQSPAAVSVIGAPEIEAKQIERVSDALREVPGLSVVQSGAPGQLTSVFTRGLNSNQTQVMLNGIPINQGLSGAFDFSDLTTDNIERIEIVRGPQSTIYGPSAMAGVIQLFTKQGTGEPGAMVSAEGGSYGAFRETLESDGKVGPFDYSLGISRLDTDNARPNNQYRNTAVISDLGWSPDMASSNASEAGNPQLRLDLLLTYSLSDTGNPGDIRQPRPYDNFLVERWLIGPHADLKLTDWWEHKFIFSFDHERQLNDPNDDGFTFATRALFERTQVDYQNDLRPTSWLTITSGFFHDQVNAGQERPFVLFGPEFISDHTENDAGFAQATFSLDNLILVAGGRYDWFNQFGGVWTYRVAGSYKIDRTDTTLHSSVATGFTPPSSQDKIFGDNFGLEPERVFGWDIGVEQRLWEKRITLGLTYFHNDLSNLIGLNGLFQTLNLGAAETQGLEAELRAAPVKNLLLTASYTYLDAQKTSRAGISQLDGARLPRRPRNDIYFSVSYLWCNKLRTTLAAKWVNAREEINFGAPNYDIEDYNFVNFAAEYEINSYLSLFGRIDNLTNEHYSEVHQLDFIGLHTVDSGFPALGRALYAGVKLRF